MPTERARGLTRLMAAQFTSGLADNALLLVAIAQVTATGGPAWWLPLLKLLFTLSYVVLAPVAGPLADRWPKARVMGLANAVKALSCAAMALGAPVLACFCVAGAGAAVYSPAKYGLVTELVPARRLVAANGWIEVTTVLSILLGTLLGGVLCSDTLAAHTAGHSVLSPFDLAFGVLLGLYGLAALLNIGLPHSGVPLRPLPPLSQQFTAFARDNTRLWQDPLGQISLATTTLFWGIGATLQLLVLRWAELQLGLDLSEAAYLQGLSAVGVVVGAALAGRWVALEQAPRVLGLGVLLGLTVWQLNTVTDWASAAGVLCAAGVLGGLFVVPMNALLQHRGCVLLSAGRSVAVQNFNENASVLLMVGAYTLALREDMALDRLVTLAGALTAAAMCLIALRHRWLRQRPTPSPHHTPALPTCKDLP